MLLLKSFFVTRTAWGWPIKFILFAFSILIMPVGVLILTPLMVHGVNVYRERAQDEIISKNGLKNPTVVAGDRSGFILDRDGRRFFLFDYTGGCRIVPFDDVVEFEWRWVSKSGKTKHSMAFITDDEEDPIIEVDMPGEKASETWLERLKIIMKKHRNGEMESGDVDRRRLQEPAATTT